MCEELTHAPIHATGPGHRAPEGVRDEHGYSTEFDIERYFRDAPLMIVGEGTNEIQRNVIAAQLVKRGGLRRW